MAGATELECAGVSVEAAGVVDSVDGGATAAAVGAGGEQQSVSDSGARALSESGQSGDAFVYGTASADWEQRWGHAVLLAESFVDVQVFRGTCYKVSGWQELGLMNFSS